MEFYEIDPTDQFQRTGEVIDEFETAIWTERFIEAGDFKLTLPASDGNYARFSPGMILACKGTRELMIVESRELLDGNVIGVSGRDLSTFWENRWIDKFRSTNKWPDGHIMAVVNRGQGRFVPGGGGSVYFGYIPDLETVSGENNYDSYGPSFNKRFPAGDVYNTILEFARRWQHDFGVRSGILSGSDRPMGAQFWAYLPKDRTGDGPSPLTVKFSPKLDNLANVKQLLSHKDYKSHIVVWPPKLTWPVGEDHSDPVFLSNSNDGYIGSGGNRFVKRYIEVFMTETAEDIAEETSGSTSPLWPAGWYSTLTSMMLERASKELLDHKKTKMIEGEIVAEASNYVYGTHYKLGDYVDMEGYIGDPLKGQVVEYVKSQDATGERAWPTVSMDPTPILSGAED